MNLNQVTLPVNDIEIAAAFYRRMGFLQIVESSDYARFESMEGGVTFSLSYEREKGRNFSVIYFECENLDRQVSNIKGKRIFFYARANRSALALERSYIT